MEQLIASLEVNLSFVSELLQANVRLFVKKQAEDKITLHNYFHHTGENLLYPGTTNLELQIGKELELHKDIPVHKSFETGQTIVGQYGLVVNNKPIQEFAYPIFFRNKVCAVIAVERDIYITRAILGQHWDFIADNLIKSLREKFLKKHIFPQLAFGEGALIIKNPQTIFFAAPLSVSLLSEIAEHANQFVGRSLDEIFSNYQRKYKGKNIRLSIESIEEIKLSNRTISVRRVSIDEEMSVVLIKDISEIKVKETLLKEIHHRVKNNLQTVVSLLRMQERRNPELKNSFNEAINRTNSISLVHEFLSNADDIEVIDFGYLAQRIAKELVVGFGICDLKLDFYCPCPEPLFIRSEKATNLALILNELVSNSLEHAGKDLSEIKISLYKEKDTLVLIVEDNGIGFPPDFNYKKSKGLGWEIIRTLTEESLAGQISISTGLEKENQFGRGAKVLLNIPM